jgi:hypothetical protein
MPKARDAKTHGQGTTNGQTVHRSPSFSPECHQCAMHEWQIVDQDSPVLRELLPPHSRLQLMYRAPCREEPRLRECDHDILALRALLESSIHNDIKHLFHDSAATPKAAFGRFKLREAVTLAICRLLSEIAIWSAIAPWAPRIAAALFLVSRHDYLRMYCRTFKNPLS